MDPHLRSDVSSNGVILHRFLEHLVNEKLEPKIAEVQRKNRLDSIGTAIAVVIIYLPREQTSSSQQLPPIILGMMSAIRTPDGTVRPDYSLRPRKLERRDVLIHIQMVLQIPNRPRSTDLLAPSIILRRPNYNLRFPARISDDLPYVHARGLEHVGLQWLLRLPAGDNSSSDIKVSAVSHSWGPYLS